MTYLRFDPDGLHLVEMFQVQGVTGLLPGTFPEGEDPGDEWEEDLVAGFPHLSEEE